MVSAHGSRLGETQWFLTVLWMVVLGVSAVTPAFGQAPASAQARPMPTASTTSTPGPTLEPVPKPNLSTLEDAVREQIEATQAELEAVSRQPGVSRETLAKAYGQMGKVYHAYNFFDAGAVCYQNAHALAPREFVWPYYLGRLNQEKGDIRSSIASLETARQLRPKEIPVLLSLGNAYLANGQADSAEALFQEVLALDHSSAGALAGLGKIALSKRDFTTAIRDFEAALKLQPRATELHYQLAMALRGAGDVTNALAELRQQGKGKINDHDPLMEDLDSLRSGEAILWRRGNVAMREGHYSDAIKFYNEMVTFAKDDPLPRIYLGNALATSGDLKGAIEQYRIVLRLLPHNASAHYNLGVVYLELKSEHEAMEEFSAALEVNPDFKEAHFQLANLLMRNKQYAQAVSHYTRVVQLSPANEFARLMKSVALIRLGRYADAKAELEEGVAGLPESSDLAIALARLLAACPDKSLRDPAGALSITAKLLHANSSPDFELLETQAMALASAGRFGDAVSLQKWMITEVQQAKRNDLVADLQRNLGLYERGQACPQPWQDDDPIFIPQPGKMDLLGLKEDVQTAKGVSISP